MLTYNLDRLDAQLNTKAPFTTESDISALGVAIPSASLIAINIGVKESAELPISLTSVAMSSDMEQVTVRFTDAADELVATVDIPVTWPDGLTMSTRVLLDSYGAICGHMAFTREFLAAISASCLLTAQKRTGAATGSLALLTSCCHMDIRQGVRQLYINGVTRVSDVKLDTTGDLQVTSDNGATLTRMDRFPAPVSYDSSANELQIGENGIKYVSVKDGDESASIFDAYDNSLILKAGVKSNIRISDTDNGVILGGVQDE